MNLADTIIAAATGPGRSARAVVRLSGPGVEAALREITRASLARGASVVRLSLAIHPHETDQNQADHAEISSRGELPALVLRSFAPHSYTGEDTAELLIPGNPSFVDRVLTRLTSVTATTVRLAEPGEFTARAYLHGKLNIEQAEGVAATIAARTIEELDAAKDLLGGGVGRLYHAWADETATLLALVESGVDFSDQEGVVAIAPDRLRARLKAIINAIEVFTGGSAGAEARSHRPTVVMVGAPNAGKSTLFNALLGRSRAVVSPQAGTTRDVLREPLDLTRELPGASIVDLIDLAGLDTTIDAPFDAPVEVQAQRAARDIIARADAAIYCDPSGVFSLQNALANVGTIIRVRTKADLPAPSANARPTSDEAAHHLLVCALDGWNLATLKRAIADVSGGTRGASIAALLPRHRRALAATLYALGDALSLVEQSTRDQAIIADTLRAALDSLGELVGRISPDDVLGRIFSTFCVGK